MVVKVILCFLLICTAFVNAGDESLPPLCLYDDAELVEQDGIQYLSVGPHGPPWNIDNAGTCYIDNWPFLNMKIAEKKYRPSRWTFESYWACGEWIPSFNSTDSTISSYANDLLFMFHMVYIRFIPESAPFTQRQIFQFWTYSDAGGKDGDNIYSIAEIKDAAFAKGDKIRWFALHLFKPVGDLPAGQHFWVQINDDKAHYGYNSNTSLYTSNIYRFYFGCGSHGAVFYPQVHFKREPACGKIRTIIGAGIASRKDVEKWLAEAAPPDSFLLAFPDQKHDGEEYPALLPENVWAVDDLDNLGTLLRFRGGNVDRQKPKRTTQLLLNSNSQPIEISTRISESRYKNIFDNKPVLALHFKDIAEIQEQRFHLQVTLSYQPPFADSDSMTIHFFNFNGSFIQIGDKEFAARLPDIWNRWTFLTIDLQQILNNAARMGWIPHRSRYFRPLSIKLQGKILFTDVIFSRNKIGWPSHFSAILNLNAEYDPLTAIKAWPNPANDWVRFSFYMPERYILQPIIYSMLGKKVNEYPMQIFYKGLNRLDWDAHNDSDERVASGIYFIVLNGKMGNVLSQKFTLIK